MGVCGSRFVLRHRTSSPPGTNLCLVLHFVRSDGIGNQECHDEGKHRPWRNWLLGCIASWSSIWDVPRQRYSSMIGNHSYQTCLRLEWLNESRKLRRSVPSRWKWIDRIHCDTRKRSQGKNKILIRTTVKTLNFVFLSSIRSIDLSHPSLFLPSTGEALYRLRRISILLPFPPNRFILYYSHCTTMRFYIATTALLSAVVSVSAFALVYSLQFVWVGTSIVLAGMPWEIFAVDLAIEAYQDISVSLPPRTGNRSGLFHVVGFFFRRLCSLTMTVSPLY